MNDLQKMLKKAQRSSFRLWLLNRVLWRVIPFNAPHRLQLVAITDEGLRIRLPYVRRNLNHIKGLHACGLATLAEFTTGLTLLYHLGTTQYRLIMKKIEMEYHYQGKQSAYAEFNLTKDWIQEEIIAAIRSEGSIVRVFEVEIADEGGNKLCTGHVHWQLKDWSRVQTKV